MDDWKHIAMYFVIIVGGAVVWQLVQNFTRRTRTDSRISATSQFDALCALRVAANKRSTGKPSDADVLLNNMQLWTLIYDLEYRLRVEFDATVGYKFKK